MPKSAVALLSGGLDSIVATALAWEEGSVALAITVDYGQRAAEREIAAAVAFCARFDIPHRVHAARWLGALTRTALVARDAALPQTTLDALDDDAQERAAAVWVPNRNGLFVAIAACYAEAKGCDAVVAGLNAEEAATFPDNSAAFVERTNAALAYSTRNGVTLISPTIAMTKRDIAERFVALHLDPELFWCCYEGGTALCGRCESCVRTLRAFAAIGNDALIEKRFER